MPKHSRPNDWAGNSMSYGAYLHMQKVLPKGKTILELGSGWGSGELMKRWNLYSIESNEEWFKKFNPQSFLVPTVGERHVGSTWYDIEILEAALQGLEYDFLLIDGPHRREMFPAHLDLFDTSVPMLFDDVRREEGQTAIKKVSLLVGRPYKIYNEGTHRAFGCIKGEKDE